MQPRKSPRKDTKPRRRLPEAWKGRLGRLAAALAVTVAGVAGMGVLRGRLLTSPQYAGKLARVRLAEPPSWLPADIADEILAAIQSAANGRSVFEPALAGDLYRAAGENPWVARVHEVVKKHDGTVLVRADFRRPFALVGSMRLPPEDLAVVDSEGVVLPLPLRRVKRDEFITIRGVDTRPPPPGRKWNAPDLGDGLRLLKLIQDKPYADQVTTIDVKNYAGRISQADPHLRLYAQVGTGGRTDIRFGRFPSADGLDYCISPQRKLAYLDTYVRAHQGRLAGIDAYIDLRYDDLYVSQY